MIDSALASWFARYQATADMIVPRLLALRHAPPSRQRRPPKPTLASAKKQASKAGIDVARYEIKPDGTVVVVPGTPESPTESNPWLADLKVTKR